MRKFMSHKVVHAAKIISAEKQEDGRWHFMREGAVHDTTTVEESPRFKMTKNDLGYVVHYADGYISWSPTKAFEEGYTAIEGDTAFADARPDANMSFGDALLKLRDGKKVCRAGWNGKDMWLVLVGGTPDMELTPGTVYHQAGLTHVSIDAHIDMMTAGGTMQPGWLASQADMLADDWLVID